MGTCQAKREGSDKTPEEQAESLEQSEAELPGYVKHCVLVISSDRL